MIKQDLILLEHLLDDPIVRTAVEGDFHETTSHLFANLDKFDFGAPLLLNHTIRKIFHVENAFAKIVASGIEVDASLKFQLLNEMLEIFGEVNKYPEQVWLATMKKDVKSTNHYYDDFLQAILDVEYEEAIEILINFHKKFGWGELSKYNKFKYDVTLVGVENPDPITLDDLVGYEYQKQEIIANTELLVNENRGNNLLLYGERGTGKSSMVKSVANQYMNEGLCLVEVPVKNVGELPKIVKYLSEQPRKFIVFLDDLSFSAGDDSYKYLKGILEGGISSISKNILIYATSNRRNIIEEKVEDRNSSADPYARKDNMSEKLSLSDRFGKTIVFEAPNQKDYLEIILAMAKAENITIEEETLKTDALKWALWQNARSGRTARQFIANIANKN